MKLTSIVHFMRFISGTTWDATVGCLQRLFEALFLGLLRYTLPVINNTCITNIRALQSIQAQALRTCLGLPRSASTPGTIAEARRFPIEAYMIQETLRLHMRHLTQHSRHHFPTEKSGLATLPTNRRKSSFSRTIRKHNTTLNNFNRPSIKSIPPWTFLTPEVVPYIKGIHKKSSIPLPVLKQLALRVINETHGSTKHVYTDGSSSGERAGAGIVIPAHSNSSSFEIGHKTTSTASELAAIREAARYILCQAPQCWTIFSDSRSALQIIQSSMKNNAYDFLAYQIFCTCHRALQQGHHITLQWIPGHCGVAGNEAADSVAKSTSNGKKICIPYSRCDTKILVQDVAKGISQNYWMNPHYHHPRLYSLDPQLAFRVPSGLSRQLEAVLHRLRLGVA
ncbi:uncharacterized protein LOC121836800, partial [Ixodes scapularis]|uniref:uncharacterized protein LOC121836800 n=1 Tax=Ixodes scapularis TaxID=6945 RepID=UPI001C38F697